MEIVAAPFARGVEYLLAGRLVAATDLRSGKVAEDVSRVSEVWAKAIATSADPLLVATSKWVADLLSERERFAVLMRACRSAAGVTGVLGALGPDGVITLVQMGDGARSSTLLDCHSSLFIQVPKLLEIVSQERRMQICGRVLLEERNDPGVVREFANAVVNELSRWNAAGPDADLAGGAREQARVLLGMPPAIAERLAQSNTLLPELQHVLGCGPSRTCLDVKSIRDRAGHAVGFLAAAVVSGGDARSAQSVILDALCGGARERTRPSSGEAVNRLADEVLTMFGERSLTRNVGALARLIPRCPVGEAPFCEGKPAGLRDEGTKWDHPFCPRLKSGCAHASVAVELSSPVSRWGLKELIGSTGETTLDLYGKTLINSVAGWVNRLFEISHRMQCEGCSAPLTFDPRYSKKFDARYHDTVMTCSAGCGAGSVYFNHCYACHGLIDSRESRFVEPAGERATAGDAQLGSAAHGGYYLCINCANNLKPWCPKCGKHCGPSAGSVERRCPGCGHVVRLRNKARLPRISASYTVGPWGSGTFESREHPDWDSHPMVGAVRLLAGTGAVDSDCFDLEDF